MFDLLLESAGNGKLETSNESQFSMFIEILKLELENIFETSELITFVISESLKMKVAFPPVAFANPLINPESAPEPIPNVFIRVFAEFFVQR
jgi:hypothetical protein